MRYVRYQPAEDLITSEGTIEDYWEIADDGYVIRSVHIRCDGSLLKYDLAHDADEFGVLPEGVIDDELLSDSSLGKITFLRAVDFELKWSLKAKNEERT